MFDAPTDERDDTQLERFPFSAAYSRYAAFGSSDLGSWFLNSGTDVKKVTISCESSAQARDPQHFRISDTDHGELSLSFYCSGCYI